MAKKRFRIAGGKKVAVGKELQLKIMGGPVVSKAKQSTSEIVYSVTLTDPDGASKKWEQASEAMKITPGEVGTHQVKAEAYLIERLHKTIAEASRHGTAKKVDETEIFEFAASKGAKLSGLDKQSGPSGPEPLLGSMDAGDQEYRTSSFADLKLTARMNVPIELQRSHVRPTRDLILWGLAKRNRDLFNRMRTELLEAADANRRDLNQGIDAYHGLRLDVNAWMAQNFATQADAEKIQENLSIPDDGVSPSVENVRKAIDSYFQSVGNVRTLPYLKRVISNRGLLPLGDPPEGDPDGYIRERLTKPALCELIWSYWHEESMMVQSFQAVTLRFQNKLQSGGRDPLASFNTSPLRSVGNLLWGHIQAEHERLSVRRRNYEYDHHYGIYLHGKAVEDFTPADSRKTFMGAFNQLLFLLTKFYKEKDDTTVKADAFPILNALREVHLILSEGAHNQFGDLPWTARLEMFVEQSILGRKEMVEFLGGRSMVPYRQPWMEVVDTMKRIQGWTDVSCQHFNTLAETGESVLITIRYGDWNDPNLTAENAENWAMSHRSDVQEYLHAYRAVTGVDLTDQGQVDNVPPSVHLRKKLEQQTGRAA